MGRILKRIFSTDISGKINDIINLEVDVVMNNKSVLHGVIISATADGLLLRNIVRNKQSILFSDINEIFFV